MDENKELEKAGEHGWEPVKPGSVEFPKDEDDQGVAPEVKEPPGPDKDERPAPTALAEQPRSPEDLSVGGKGAHEVPAEDGEPDEAFEQVEDDRRRHDEAVKELMKDIRELRERTKRQKLNTDELQAEADKLVSRFLETSDGKTLKQVLPDRARAKTGREKISEVVMMGLKLKAWDDSAFMVRYHRRFGREVEEAFKQREKELVRKQPL